MSDQIVNAWKCSVCGYVHRASQPPEWCPVCGAAREAFEPYVDLPLVPVAESVPQWQCLNCNHVHAGNDPPETCPVCGVRADNFRRLTKKSKEPASLSGKSAKVVIVGAGIAGISAAQAVRAGAPDAQIALISKERHLPYYRLNLTRLVAGEITEDAMPIHPEQWYHEQKIELLRGLEVTGIRLKEQQVELSDGQQLPFDKLILSAGAHPFVPAIPGASRQGVTSFRTLDDAKFILEAGKSWAKCVCIGGGILGLETAGGLARQGSHVALLEGFGRLLPRQLNQAAADMLTRHVTGMGIELMTNAVTAEIVGDERARAVRLEDNRAIPADVVVICTGIRPNSYLARSAGLRVNQGLIVDDHLVSSHPNVLAAGDVAEHRGTIYGIWGPAQYQGNIAGMNALGLGAEFGGIPRTNTLKVLGVELFSIGQVEPADASYIQVDGASDGNYHCFVFRDNRLVGAILLGDAALTAEVKKAVEGGTDFSDLLRKHPTAANIREELAQR